MLESMYIEGLIKNFDMWIVKKIILQSHIYILIFFVKTSQINSLIFFFET